MLSKLPNCPYLFEPITENFYNLFKKILNTFETFLKNIPQDSCGMLLQTLRSIVGVLTSFKNIIFQIILKKELLDKIHDF